MKEEIFLLGAIRKKGYDLAINLTEGDRGAIACLASGARYRVGFDPGKKGFFGKRRIYTHLVKNCPTPRHRVERDLDVLRRIGIFPAKEERELFCHIPQEAQERIEEIAPYCRDAIVLHLTSRWRFKSLPVVRAVELMKKLNFEGHRLILVSGPERYEQEAIQEIQEKLKGLDFLNLSDKLSLKEYAALIKKCRCLITVDSLPLHIASAFKTPVVALFGPTSEQQWGPWNHPRARVIADTISCRPCLMDGCGGSKRSDCLYTIDLEKVIDAVGVLTKRPSYPFILV